MLKLNRNQKREPFGGHHFPDHGVTFKANSYDELVKKVEQFRANNAIPLGNPSQEILEFYAKHAPFMVLPDNESIEIAPKSDYQDARDWIYKTWRNPPQKTVGRLEAKDRWECCKNCKFNVAFPDSPNGELDALKRRAFMLRKGEKIPDFLGFCSLHRADLGVFVFIEQAMNYSEKKKDTEVANGCWLQ